MILITLKIGILFINVYDEGLIKSKLYCPFLKMCFCLIILCMLIIMQLKSYNLEWVSKICNCTNLKPCEIQLVIITILINIFEF